MKYTKVALTVLCSHFDDCMCASLEKLSLLLRSTRVSSTAVPVHYSSLAPQQVCCSSLSGLKYQPLIADQKRIVAIDGNSPVFTFPEGKRATAAFKLPSNSGDLKITIAGDR